MNNMSYRQRSKRKTRIALLGASIAILLLLTFFHIPLPKTVQNTLRTLGTPLYALRSTLGNIGVSVLSITTPRSALLEEQDALRTQIADQSRIQSENNFLKTENKRLRALVGYATLTTNTPTHVLVGPPTVPYDTLIVDSRQIPIKKDTLVFAKGDITAIGTVTRLLGSTAEVTLFSHPTTQISARIGSEGLPVTIRGVGGGSMMAEIPQDAPITTGDTVTITSASGRYVIGTVQYIEHHTHDAESTLYINSRINLFTTHDVFFSSEKVFTPAEKTEE